MPNPLLKLFLQSITFDHNEILKRNKINPIRCRSILDPEIHNIKVLNSEEEKIQVGCGASVYATGSGATSEDCKNVETLFSKVGKCWR